AGSRSGGVDQEREVHAPRPAPSGSRYSSSSRVKVLAVRSSFLSAQTLAQAASISETLRGAGETAPRPDHPRSVGRPTALPGVQHRRRTADAPLQSSAREVGLAGPLDFISTLATL